jgi:Zn-dependent peptidase ImmA (M78 family)/DNA-binding XRE family transcriptional regulator
MRPSSNTLRMGLRLQSGRKRLGLRQEEVASRLGMARTTLVAIEKGERAVKPEELVSLASLLQMSLSELQRATDPLPSIALQFRGQIDENGRRELESQCRSLAEDYLHVEGLRNAPLPRLLPPEVLLGADPVRSARIAAEDERRRLGLGLEPIVNVRGLIEERFGVRVFQFRLDGASKVSAVYFYEEPAGAVVCVNCAHRWRRRRLSLSHELGHVLGSRHQANVLEAGARGSTRNASEKFADAFQRHFLMPAGGLERFVSTRRQERGGRLVPNDIVELADTFGVSFEAMCRSLEDDALIRPGVYDYLNLRGFKPVYDSRADSWFSADADTDLVGFRFRRLAVAAYLERQISEGSLAKLLRADRIEARAIVRRLVGDGDTLSLEDGP